MYIVPYCLYASIHRWALGCFHFLAVVNDAALNVGVHADLWDPAFISLGYKPRSGIAGPYGNPGFHFLRLLRGVFLVAVPFYVPAHNSQGA